MGKEKSSLTGAIWEGFLLEGAWGSVLKDRIRMGVPEGR